MTDTVPEPRFLSVPEVALLCGVTRNTAYRWVQQGRLAAYRTPGRTNQVRPVDLIQFMQQHGMFVPTRLYSMADTDVSGMSEQQTSNDPPALMIVSSEPALRSLVVRVLQGKRVIYQASTGYEALHLVLQHGSIQVVVFDDLVRGQPEGGLVSELIRLRSTLKVVQLGNAGGELEDPLLATWLPRPVDTEQLKQEMEDLL